MGMMIKNLLIAFACIAMSGCVTEPDESLHGLEVGESLPNFSVTMTDVTVADNASLSGSVAIVAFFRTTCPDCQQELPALQRVYDEFPDVKVVLISVGEGESSISDYWVKNSLTLPYSVQADRAVAQAFKVSAVPQVYVCDDGVVRFVHSDNPIATYEQLEQELNQLLKR